MNVVFRVDSSIQIGTGHIMRCLTLAGVLYEKGLTISFICRKLPGNICDFVEKKGFHVHRLPYIPMQCDNNNQSPEHAQWLGAGLEEDAEQTKTILAKEDRAIDWLIVDHYALDRQWETLIRPYAKKIMVIDDLADRPHDCDLLLDQNLHENMETRYKGLVPEHCQKLLGPKYVLLRSEFREAKKNLRQRDGNVQRILIFFGGSDPTNETSKAMEAVRLLNRPDIVIDVVIGAANPHKEQIEHLCSAMANVTFHCHVDNVAQLMANADLAIGAGGTTTWERCSLGLPSIVFSIAHNQEAIAQHVAQAGALINLGTACEVTVKHLVQTLKHLIKERDTLCSMSSQGLRIVEGLGVERIVKGIGINSFRITIVSDAYSWINAYIPHLLSELKNRYHKVQWVHTINEIPKGDFVFYLGCGQIVPKEILSRNKHNLIVHESNLPHGKGWSPLTWQILEGKNEIQITLFEAVEVVDSGKIYLKDMMKFNGTELVDELRQTQAEASIGMCLQFINDYPDVVLRGVDQQGTPTLYLRRRPEDSRLDPDKTIREQFDLLRIVDNKRYPAFFEMHGKIYILEINKKK